MKKIMKYAAKAAGVALAVGVYFHFNVGNEINYLFKTVAMKLAPWVNTVIYS